MKVVLVGVFSRLLLPLALAGGMLLAGPALVQPTAALVAAPTGASAPRAGVAPPPAARAGDPRWRFYTADRTRYRSPWFAGAHRIMIPFGCTRAPYYSPDRRCRHGRGFHHGIDVATPCGTRLRAGVRLRAVSARALGPGYGARPVLLRSHRHRFDLVIGHTRRVRVRPGEVVRAGQVFAHASDDGAPDGCHLHFEKRALRGGLATAVHPRRLLALRPRG